MFILGPIIFWGGGGFSVAVGSSLFSTGFAVNCLPPACVDVGHDSGMDNGPSQTDPQTSKIMELRDR